MNKTLIAWTDFTINIVSGCSKPAAVPAEMRELAEQLAGNPIDARWFKDGSSPECSSCYAESLSLRRGWSEKPWRECFAAENVKLRPERIRELARLPLKPMTLPPSKRTKAFICSMGDIGHRLVPDALLGDLWLSMQAYPNIYQLLTKRPERFLGWKHPWPAHIWLGATCGHPVTKWRIEILRRTPAPRKFLSMEPLLASMLPLDLRGIDWVIVGGESGANYRPMRHEWVREIRDECAKQNVAFFMKQSAAAMTERGCYVIEPDGRCMAFRQFPGELTPPYEVAPDNERKHFQLYPQLPKGTNQ